MSVRPFYWKRRDLLILDQRQLPDKIKYLRSESPTDVATLIRAMAVRGAPAIGCCAAYGMVLSVQLGPSHPSFSRLVESAKILKEARPTAVNLAWALDRMILMAKSHEGVSRSRLTEILLKEAKKIEAEDFENNKAMGRAGAALFGKEAVILTHCNTGALATAGHGTALGIIRELHLQKKLKKVIVDETRPYLQGARLTAWELDQEHIPHELITDNMAAHLMKTERVSAVIVGCDRVVANGDTANKIGTYSLAILAQYHEIPFYVAMPLSTLDLSKKTGMEIVIEERPSEEVVTFAGKRIAPKKTRARHPAFDVTPGILITALITEKGVVKPPFGENLRSLRGRQRRPEQSYEIASSLCSSQ